VSHFEFLSQVLLDDLFIAIDGLWLGAEKLIAAGCLGVGRYETLID
jgi:hypothetical protein